MRIEITRKQANELIESLKMSAGCSFTNTEPSNLCYEYRIETGYWLSEGRSKLVQLVTTRSEEDSGEFETKAFLCLDEDSLSISEEGE